MVPAVTHSETTQALARRAQDGDRAAYGLLVERFSHRLEALVEARLGPALRSEFDREEVVQETFRRALEDMDRFEWTGDDAFLRWLGGIVENLLRNTARTASRRPTVVQVLEIPVAPTSPSVRLRRDERFERLERALASLPPDHREVIRLCRIERLKTAEVAERMGRSHDAVRQLIVRAMRGLKDAFGDTESFHLPDRRLEAEGSDE